MGMAGGWVNAKTSRVAGSTADDFARTWRKQLRLFFPTARFQGLHFLFFMQNSSTSPSFFTRLKLAGRVLTDVSFAGRISQLLSPAVAPAAPAATPVAKPVERSPAEEHASGLAVLAMLQREGRLIDFLKEDVAAFSDAEIGAAARVVHAGSRKVLSQYFTLAPIMTEAEGAAVTIKPGFDAQQICLTGNIAGQPPFRGELKHHGWIATEVRLPAVSASMDARVVAPAEVQL